MSKTDVVVFYANDLCKAPINDGTAMRLTTGEGYDFDPHFSNDGKTIAFTGEYDGNTDVYIIPSEDGEPKRLTFQRKEPKASVRWKRPEGYKTNN